MRRTSFAEMECSIARCLEVVGDWWTLLIVRDAFLGFTRFDDFQRRNGIASNVLTNRLDALVANGVLVRERYQDNPPRDEYRLTDKGADLGPVLSAMRAWGDKWDAPDGPPVQMVHDTCGQVSRLRPVCSACGEVVHRDEFHMEPTEVLKNRSFLGEGRPAFATGTRTGPAASSTTS
jgi:DNA-binding HxlR family transcriptional regulator